MTAGSTVTIGLLLPDVLGTYSDSGNATVLAQRLRWRGIATEVVRCTADMTPPSQCDLYVLGGGEDTAQVYAARWLREHGALRRALAGNAVTLAVCAGMQILGQWMTAPDGQRYAGAELLDLTTTRPRRRRATGELIVDCALPGVGLLTGFENHSGATTLGAGVLPLGRVLAGVGNGERGGRARGVEGACSERVVATYMHGPVLARNPALADHLLSRVLGSPLPEPKLPEPNPPATNPPATDPAEVHVPDQDALRGTYLKSMHLHRH